MLYHPSMYSRTTFRTTLRRTDTDDHTHKMNNGSGRTALRYLLWWNPEPDFAQDTLTQNPYKAPEPQPDPDTVGLPQLLREPISHAKWTIFQALAWEAVIGDWAGVGSSWMFQPATLSINGLGNDKSQIIDCGADADYTRKALSLEP